MNDINDDISIGYALRTGWRAMFSNMLVFLLAVLVITVFMVPFNLSGGDGHDSDASAVLGLLETAYIFLLYPVINYGADMIFLRGVRSGNVDIKQIFDGFRNYLDIVLSYLLVVGLIGIGLIVFVIPGIYVACRLVFVSYLVMDEGHDPISAVEASWRITRGHTGRIFLLALISVVLFILGLILLLVGALPATMWIKSSFAALYLSITRPDAEL